MAYELTIAPALAALLEPVIRPLLKGDRALDVGCGGGEIAKRLGGGAVFIMSVDPSRSQVRRFNRHLCATGEAVLARAEVLPFANSIFDSLYSSCAWKHWPMPTKGTAECLRVTKPGGSVVVIEIDGSANADEFWSFAQKGRIPIGLRRAYLRFAMRTVVGVAPSKDALAASFDGLTATGLNVRRIEATPFLLATASAN